MKLKSILVGAAALSAGVGIAFADGGESVDVAEAASAKLAQKSAVKPFFTIPLCRRIELGGEVRKPGSSTWEPLEEGLFYPLGCSFRAVANGTVTIALGKDCSVEIANGSAFTTRAQGLSVQSRTIQLDGGEVAVSLPTSLEPGLFFVTAPGFTVKNAIGKSNFVFHDKGDGFEADVRCVTGTLEVEGRHFKIPRMRAADAFTIRSSRDDLETFLYGRSGDYIAQLDRGIIRRSVIDEDGNNKEICEPGVLDWHLSVDTRVQINRAVPAVGKRLSVSIMTFDASGALKNNFAYAEGRSEVNTGELVKAPVDNAEIAKRAAEVTTESVASDTEDVPAETESGDASADSDEDF